MTAFHDWLHAQPNNVVQALRDFRRCAREAYPDDPNYLSTAYDSGKIEELLHPMARPAPALSPQEAAAKISAMPREFVIQLHV